MDELDKSRAGHEEMHPLRILHISVAIERGGAENHLFELIKRQLSAGNAVKCAYLKGGDYWRGPLEELGAEIISLGMKRYGDAAPLFKVRRLIRDFKPDIVHAHGAVAELYALAAKSFIGVRPKFIVTRHELRFRLFDIPGYAAADRLVAAGADRVIAVSQAILDTDVARCPALQPKISVVHHGLAPLPDRRPQREEVRRHWGVADETVVMGTVGRLSPEKDLATLLRGYAAFRAKNIGLETALVVVGHGPQEQELADLADALGLANHVIWAGFREDIPSVMAAFDIFIFTAIIEGFGLVLLEAMAESRAILAADAYASPEVVGSGALLFPPGDALALSEGMAKLATDPELRARLGAAGNKRLRGHFTLSAMSKKTMAVYRDSLS